MRWFLIIPMALFEIIFLGVCWVAAFAHPATGKRLIEWSIRTLPSPDWYLNQLGKASIRITENQAYVAIRADGFVDGACFTESEDSVEWCREMELAGMKIEVRDRAEAKRILFTTLSN